MAKRSVIVLVDAEAAMPKAPTGQKTDGVIQIILELYPRCSGLHLFFHPFIVEVVIRHMVLDFIRQRLSLIIKEARATILDIGSGQHLIGNRRVSKDLGDIHSVITSQPIVGFQQEDGIASTLMVA